MEETLLHGGAPEKRREMQPAEVMLKERGGNNNMVSVKTPETPFLIPLGNGRPQLIGNGSPYCRDNFLLI